MIRGLVLFLVLDWGLFVGLLNHVIVEKLGAQWAEHPILFVDNPSWSRETREKVVQVLFEKFEVPALFLGRAPVLAAFAIGKHSGLVVDFGASSIRVGPVCEGYLIKTGVMQQPLLGGNALSEQSGVMLMEECKMESIPIPQQVAQKRPVDLAQLPDFEPRQLKGVTESFIGYHRSLVLDDFKESVVQVSETPYNPSDLSRRPPKFYEFPDGYNRNFTAERFRIGEQILNPGQFRYACDGTGVSLHGLTDLIQKSLLQCDAEIRNTLIGNLILTGGGSSLTGLSERINYELGQIPSFGRARLHMGPTVQERRFGPWVGGSILASLATFQQLWLTKQEYTEHGAAYIDRKCP